MILFENNGILDLDAMRAFGVNVKEDNTAIGYFGTGLKYAIAVSMRLGLPVTMILDGRYYSFYKRQKSIRGKTFDFIMFASLDGLVDEQLGFTTELGKNWQKWMAFREFYCNAKDEGGNCRPGAPDATAGKTIFVVEGMDDIYYEFGKYFIDDSPIVTTPSVDIHEGPADVVFYRGICTNSTKHDAKYRYNIKYPMPLTEDRTMSSLFLAEERIAEAIARCDNEQLIHSVVTASELTFEGNLRFPYFTEPSKAFLNALHPIRHDRNVNKSALKLYRKCTGEDDLDKENTRDPSEQQQVMLDKVLDFLDASGCRVDCKIRIVESLGKGFMAEYSNGVIYLPQEIFERGILELALTLLEERQHYVGYDDYSREYQDWLQRKLILAWAEIQGVTL